MTLQWYIRFGDKEQGPYSFLQMKEMPDISPDTWVRRKGHSLWKRAGDDPDLAEIFKDDEVPTKNGAQDEARAAPCPQGDVLVVEGKEPPYLFVWLVIAILILCYILYGLR